MQWYKHSERSHEFFCTQHGGTNADLTCTWGGEKTMSGLVVQFCYLSLNGQRQKEILVRMRGWEQSGCDFWQHPIWYYKKLRKECDVPFSLRNQSLLFNSSSFSHRMCQPANQAASQTGSTHWNIFLSSKLFHSSLTVLYNQLSPAEKNSI